MYLLAMKISNKKLYMYVFVLIFLPLFVRFFTDNFGMSYMAMPLFDIYAVTLLFVSFYVSKKNSILELWFLFFIFTGMISIVVNGGVSLLNLFYNIRPYFRMIIAMMISEKALKVKHIEKLYKYVEVLLYVNAIVMTYQFLF